MGGYGKGQSGHTRIFAKRLPRTHPLSVAPGAAVTKLRGDAQQWESHPSFCKAMANNPIKILTLREMPEEVYCQLSATLAGTELGRMLRLFRAAGVQI